MSLPEPSAPPSRLPRRRGAKLSLLVLAAGLVATSALHAQGGQHPGKQSQAAADRGGPMVVTTDSPDYCRTLSDAVARHPALPREVRELKAEGDGLCREGRIRGGITRLRRALLALRKNEQASR